MSERWERSVEEWYEKSKTSRLEHLDLANQQKVSTRELANNISVIYDRLLLFSRVTIKHFKVLEEKQEKLEKEFSKFRILISELTSEVTERKPLSKQEVRELVKEIAAQPKLIEEQSLKIAADLDEKVRRIEESVNKLYAHQFT